MSQQINDPGFGSGPGRGHVRILKRDGAFNVRRKGARFHPSDVYHIALNTTWTWFIVNAMLIYVLVNVAFALLYLGVGVDAIGGTRTESLGERFADAIFFSAQTLTTVGYGTLSPSSNVVSIIAGFEALFGLILFGVFTGLSFGRFSRIKPRISFSDQAIIAPYRNKTNALMFRLVNERAGAIMNSNMSVILTLEFMEDNRLKRKFYNLDLEINHIKTLALSWTVVHPISADSPLVKLSTHELKRVNAEIIVVMEAFDDTVGQNFYARKSYSAQDIVLGRKFIPMFHPDKDKTVMLNLNLLGTHEEAELFSADYLDQQES